MGILIDTSILINFDRDKTLDFVELLYQKHQQGIALHTSVLVEYEYLYGLKKTRVNSIDIADFHFEELNILPITRELIAVAVKIEQRYQIGKIDSLIAATCLHHKLQLATLNIKHFKMIKELKLWQSA